jgi:regulator of protease activity HflC (stomatin/prohibitin superfamily)
MNQEVGIILFLIIFFVIIILANAIRILREYERGVIFRLGRLIATKGPGLIFLIPIVDRMVRVSLRVVAMEVPSQDVITRDNVSIKVSAVIYFRVIDASKAIVVVENFLFATSQLSQTTLRSMLGKSELDELLSKREKINKLLQETMDTHTAP